MPCDFLSAQQLNQDLSCLELLVRSEQCSKQQIRFYVQKISFSLKACHKSTATYRLDSKSLGHHLRRTFEWQGMLKLCFAWCKVVVNFSRIKFVVLEASIPIPLIRFSALITDRVLGIGNRNSILVTAKNLYLNVNNEESYHKVTFWWPLYLTWLYKCREPKTVQFILLYLHNIKNFFQIFSVQISEN